MEKLSIFQKLTNVQVELNVPKNQFNKFGNYKYRSCEDILSELKKLQKKHGFALVMNDMIHPSGSRTYVCAMVSFVDSTTGEKITASAFARESDDKKGMDAAQITGASSSYARKYALSALFAIDDGHDYDSQEKESKQEQAPAIKTITPVKPVVPEKPKVTKKTDLSRIQDAFKKMNVDKSTQDLLLDGNFKDDLPLLLHNLTLVYKGKMDMTELLGMAWNPEADNDNK